MIKLKYIKFLTFCLKNDSAKILYKAPGSNDCIM